MKSATVTIVSLGVICYPGAPLLEEVSCAQVDAARFHGALRLGLGEHYDQWRSVPAIDLAAHEARALVELTARAMPHNSVLVVYFSGHAEFHEGRLSLLFHDTSGEARGRLLVEELAAACREANSVLFLDCCHSGAALGLANRTDVLSPSRLSVLASSEAFSTAEHLLEGSPFTTRLVSVLEETATAGSQLGLVEIARRVNDDTPRAGRCVVNIAEGAEDVVIVPRSLEPKRLHDVASQFYSRISGADRYSRELMWYAATELPIAYQSEIIRRYFKEERVGEASWLVRRAIGSFIGAQPRHSGPRFESSVNLLRSSHWMEACVGLIATRQVLTESPMREAAENILLSEMPANATWLASLYLTDCGVFLLDKLDNSPLTRTSWGLSEIWEQYRGGATTEERLLERITELAQMNADDVEIRAFRTHLRLKGVPIDGDCDLAIVNDPLARYLYALTPRGGLVASSGKWLLSSLFGNWRREGRANLAQYASSRRRDAVWSSLAKLRSLPSAALREAVLSDPWIAADKGRAEAVLGWGLQDDHPWVRRAAVELAGDGRVGPVTAPLLNMVAYPGVFDLILTARDAGAGTDAIVDGLDLTPFECSALQRDGVRVLET